MNVLVVSKAKIFANYNTPNVNIIHLRPELVSDQQWTVEGESVLINNQELHGFLYLEKINESFSKSFAIEDQSFCDLEIKALLLDIINNEKIFSLNRYSSDAWFRGESWSYWRTVLLQENYSLSDLSFSLNKNIQSSALYLNFNNLDQYASSDSLLTRYINFGSTDVEHIEKITFLYDKIIEGNPNRRQLEVIEYLNSIGLNYASLIVDSEHNIFSVEPTPVLSCNVAIQEFNRTVLNEIEIFRVNR